MQRFSFFPAQFSLNYSLKEKWSHFDLKSWVIGETKIRPGFRFNLTQITRNPGSNFKSASDSTF